MRNIVAEGVVGTISLDHAEPGDASARCGACSDGINFWITGTLGSGVLLRF